MPLIAWDQSEYDTCFSLTVAYSAAYFPLINVLLDLTACHDFGSLPACAAHISLFG